MNFAHISDSHIASDKPDRTKNLLATIELINRYHPNLDAVIHTGDVTHNGTAQEYAEAHRILSKLNAPFFVIPGNKDNREAMCVEFSEYGYLKNNQEFIQYSIDDFDVRLIMLDTLDPNNRKGAFCSKRQAHLSKLLASDKSKPTIIGMHHTPFAVSAIPDPKQFDNWHDVDALKAILESHPTICGVYCGHIHRSINHTLGNISVQAITCTATELRFGELSPLEKTLPIIRVHTLP